MKNRVYSFLTSGLLDASRVFIQMTMPLLAMRYGAGPLLLGTIGWVAQAGRLPLCLISGPISEKTGRAIISIPSALVMALAAWGLSISTNNSQVMLCYVVGIMSVGLYYPPLEALIGDVSARGELAKNLSAFNIGWCVMSGLAALMAGWVVRINIDIPFYIAAGLAVLGAALVASWRARPHSRPHHSAGGGQFTEYPGHLVLVARMGMTVGYFGWGAVVMLFPKLVKPMGWSDGTIATTVAMYLVGQSAGIIASNASPWWRGRIWPQLVSIAVMTGGGAAIAVTSSQALFSAAFLLAGLGLGVIYTSALYHGMAARKHLGRNTGIHESLVAFGNISGCLVGGIVADAFSLRAPFIAFAALAGACLVVGIFLSREHLATLHSHKSGLRV